MAKIKIISTDLDDSEIPVNILAVSLKWGTALQDTLSLMQTAELSDDDLHMLFTLVLETAAAVFAPGELLRSHRKKVVALFEERLSVTCDQYAKDKADSQRFPR